jgi:hypothetical protein
LEWSDVWKPTVIDAGDSGRLNAGLCDGFSGVAQVDTRMTQLGEEVVVHEAATKATQCSILSVMGEEQSRAWLMERVRTKR